MQKMKTEPSSFGCISQLHEVTDQHVLQLVHQRVYTLACVDRPHLERFFFPGPQPLSIERADFPHLSKQRYVLCEKTDGQRAMMLMDVFQIDGNTYKLCVLLNRSGKVWLCPIRNIPTAMWQGTLLDGEIVEHLPTKSPVFLIFDALRISGWWLEDTVFTGRLDLVAHALQPYSSTSTDPVALKIKVMIAQEDFPAAEGLLTLKKAEYKTDGILLIPESTGFTFGRAKNMFKLKPPGTHTVDFLVGYGGQLSVYKPEMDAQIVVGRLMQSAKHIPVETVVECVYTGHEDVWKVVCIRDDKQYSNDYLTYTKTLQNEKENLFVSDVLKQFI